MCIDLFSTKELIARWGNGGLYCPERYDENDFSCFVFSFPFSFFFLLRFLCNFQGEPIWTHMGHSWKINYHTVRSMVQAVQRLDSLLKVLG
jgi:hypothetical protein